MLAVFLGLPSQQQADYTFHVQSELVLVNVTVRDKNGNFVRGLKPEDFTILEDNKPQKVISFDIENIDAVATAGCGAGQAAARFPPSSRRTPPPARRTQPRSSISSKIAA